MMFGADPDKKKTVQDPDLEWLISNSSATYVTKGGSTSGGFAPNPRSTIDHLAWRFFTHQEYMQKMHSIITENHKNLLRAQFSRLLKAGYERSDLEKMIDSYWVTPSAARAGTPVLTFCNRSFQRQLLAGTFVTASDSILKWIGNNFSRVGDLPWDESDDDRFKKLIMLEGVDPLYAYPEVVAEVLTIQEDPVDALQEFTLQLHWNWGMVDNPSNRLLELVPTVPAEVLKKGKARNKQPSLSDAVAISQGA